MTSPSRTCISISPIRSAKKLLRSFSNHAALISPGGIGFLIYAESIILEPGTVLRGCRIQLPNERVSDADLEVRYSTPVTLPSTS